MLSPNTGLIRPYSGILGELFRLCDLVLIFLTLWLISFVFKIDWSANFNAAGLVSVILFLVSAQILGLYGSWRVSNIREEIYHVWMTWALVLFGLLLVAYATKTSALFSRRVVLSWMFFTPTLLCIARLFIRTSLRKLRATGRNMRTAAIVGSGEMAQRLNDIIQSSPWLGLKLAGTYNPELVDSRDGSPREVSDDISTLINKARNKEIDVIFMSLPIEQQAHMELLTTELADTTASLYYIPNFFISDLLHAKWGYIEDIPFLSLRESPFYGADGTLKRLEDIILGTAIILLTLVPMLIIACLIKLTSRGPVLFKQQRYGLDGKPIWVWKFRTMSVMENGDTIAQATRNDPRVNRLGALLRRTSLDELPQFFNVVSGSMSIVGPRPHAVAHNEEYRKLIYGYMLRHKVKPGITGWAQVNGWRGETNTLDKMEKRIEHDIWYIRNWSLSLDLQIIFKTILHVLTLKNAY